MNRIAKYFWVALFLVCSFTLSAKQFTVVLDAGHGGKDPGAIGLRIEEKTINLNVALALGEMINEAYPDIKVIYTRDTDKFITLQDRPNIANKANADLFISIHTNASPSSSAYGVETYTLGASKNSANFEVAKRENSVILLEEGNKEKYQGFDPTSADSYIMFELMQSKYIDQSVEFASYVQNEFTAIGRYDRGVRQAIFWVLHQASMPSVLVEVGFVTNAKEEQFLYTKSGQTAIATSIFKAFEKYKHEYDKRTVNSGAYVNEVVTPKEEVKPEPKVEAKPEPKVEAKPEPKVEAKPEPKAEVNPEPKAEKNSVIFKVQGFASTKETPSSHAQYKQLASYGNVTNIFEKGYYKYMVGETSSYSEIKTLLNKVKHTFDQAFIVAFYNGTKISEKQALNIINTDKAVQATTIQEISNEPKTMYKIQAFSSSTLVDKEHADIKKLERLGTVSHSHTSNGMYVYFVGHTNSYAEISDLLVNVKKHFKDAFIITYEEK